MRRLGMILAVVLLMSLSAVAQAPRLPAEFTESVYESGLSAPTAMAFAPDGRLFVLQQGGQVRVITAAGDLLPTPFHSFTVASGGERGLLGMAFDPNFASNNYVYFYYTAQSAGGVRNKVVRLTANGDISVPGSELKILQLPFLTATNHNGGAIHFGLDGKLYVAVGENAIPALSQSMTTRLGKLLRYNADGTIPANNPFYNSASGQNRAIWALGLRNPYTFAVQPGSGTIFINDVGGGAFEEVNLGAAGANYGWPATEGYHANPSYANPLYAYSSSAEGACAIAGGAFYNPTTVLFPAAYVGDYFFADFCASKIFRRDAGSGEVTEFAAPTLAGGIVDLQVGPDGALYYLSRGGGAVYRIGFTPPPAEGELVTNGSFELDSNGDGTPDGWKVSPGLSAKRLCDAGAYITDGSCAMRVRFGTSGGALSQLIPASTLVSGTDLDVSAQVTGINVPTGTQLKVKVRTASGLNTFTLPVPIDTFDTQLVTLPTITTDAQGIRIKVIVSYPISGGKLYVDQISVFATAP